MSKAKLIIVAIFLLLIVIFALQNSEVVEVNFLFWGFSMSRAVMIFLLPALGFVFGFFVKGVSSLKT